jgi:hypothetical protein
MNPTSCNPNHNSAALWRILKKNKSAPANRKKGFYTNRDPNKQGGWIYFCMKRLRAFKVFSNIQN